MHTLPAGTACTKKKIKRDPLQNPHRETRLATESEFDALRASVVGIRQRLFHLESALSSFVPHIGRDGKKMYGYQEASEAGGDRMARDGSSGGGNRSVNESEEPETDQQRLDADMDGDVEAAVTLEFLALGRDRKEDHFSRGLVRKADGGEEAFPQPTTKHTTPPALDTSRPVSSLFPADVPVTASTTGGCPINNLPEKERSDKIIRFSLEFALWQHSAVHPDVFWSECEEFFSWQEDRVTLVNQAWLALYYSLLCAGVKHMKPNDAILCGLTLDELKTLPKVYYDCSAASLHRANFMANATVFSCQAIIVLNNACLDIGSGSDFSATLLSCGIRIAQHLNLHRFSSDEDWEQRRRKNGVDPGSPAGINGLITREIRKRLWAAMMTDDYFGAAYRRPYAINPIHCTTPLPLNVHDEDLAKGILISRPMDEPTVASKTILSLRVASCIRRFYDEISVAGSQKAALCKDVDAEIRNILRTAPSFIQPDANISHLPEFVSWLRSYHLISTDHKLLVIHRNFAGRSLRGVELAYSKAAVSEAARSILSVFLATKPDFQSVWTLPYHAIVATTTILLEMFQQPSGDVSEKRTLVKLAVARLATFNSTIAVRGVQLIETLIAEDLARRMRSGSSKKRSANEANLPDVQTLAKRMSHSATSSPALSSSTTLSPIGSNGTPHSLSHILSPDTNSGVVDPALSTMDEDGERLSTHMQESQDSLDWLLTNPMEAAWQVGGGDGSLFVQDVRVDFWRLLQGYEAPEDVAGGLDSL